VISHHHLKSGATYADTRSKINLKIGSNKLIRRCRWSFDQKAWSVHDGRIFQLISRIFQLVSHSIGIKDFSIGIMWLFQLAS